VDRQNIETFTCPNSALASLVGSRPTKATMLEGMAKTGNGNGTTTITREWHGNTGRQKSEIRPPELHSGDPF